MGAPIAKANDQVLAFDTHIVLVPPFLTPAPLPHPFTGVLNGGLAPTVKVGGQAAAVVGSTADNQPPHIPTPPGVSFQKPPTNKGTVQNGSPTVRITGKGAARLADIVMTCNDPADLPVGQIIAAGTVTAG
jgi:uncharacterized Zn-binding protein involved in type VI secretion